MQGIKERTSLFQRPAGSAISITATIVNVAAIATFPTDLLPFTATPLAVSPISATANTTSAAIASIAIASCATITSGLPRAHWSDALAFWGLLLLAG